MQTAEGLVADIPADSRTARLGARRSAPGLRECFVLHIMVAELGREVATPHKSSQTTAANDSCCVTCLKPLLALQETDWFRG